MVISRPRRPSPCRASAPTSTTATIIRCEAFGHSRLYGIDVPEFSTCSACGTIPTIAARICVPCSRGAMSCTASSTSTATNDQSCNAGTWMAICRVSRSRQVTPFADTGRCNVLPGDYRVVRSLKPRVAVLREASCGEGGRLDLLVSRRQARFSC
mgnify:CR=1 FL=1